MMQPLRNPPPMQKLRGRLEIHAFLAVHMLTAKKEALNP